MFHTLEEYSKRLAVRIALNGGKELIGSGTILVCELHNYALIFTAAHIFDDINNQPDKKVHFCFADENDNQKEIEILLRSGADWNGPYENNTGYMYLHPRYGKDNPKYPENDGAIIRVPYFDWMKGSPKFRICEIKETKAMLVGFPEENDAVIEKKKDLEFITYRGNIIQKMISVVNQHTANLVINGIKPGNIFTLDRGLDGLSGGGIISISPQGIMYNGAFASNRKIGADSYYATDSKVFLEIMDQYQLETEIPFNLNEIIKEASACFNVAADEKAYSWLKQHADEYIQNIDVGTFFRDKYIVSDIVFCKEYRPSCLYYYTNKLICRVLVGIVYEIKSGDEGEQLIKVGPSDQFVRVEHICSEGSFNRIVTETLKSKAFSSHGIFKNGSILIVSDKKQGKSDLISRKRCRRILKSIVDASYTEWENDEPSFSRIKELLAENHRDDKYIIPSIIREDFSHVNIGFVGIGRLKEIMVETECEKEKMNAQVKQLMLDVWQE